MSLTDRAHEESHNKELASAGLGGRQQKQFHVFIVQSSSLSVVQHHIVKRQKLCEKMLSHQTSKFLQISTSKDIPISVSLTEDSIVNLDC